jgi:tetratricopeptide (TPR) repeat protein
MSTEDPTLTAGFTDAETAPATATAPVPTGYELLSEIGRGGMGVVYRARDLALGREVAVKVLNASYPPGSPPAVRFLEEARITGQLQHPGIPAVHQVGALPDGRPFLAMRLIKGRTLEDRLRDCPSPGDTLAVFEAVCQAVAYAHARGVIHRDLKPQNVMVGAFGEVQVMDWGLAKVLGPANGEPEATATAAVASEIRSLREESGLHTQAGGVLGTPSYMPPEQAGGLAALIDRRSDVFGLGAILCVMLTGQPPFTGAFAEAVWFKAVRRDLADAFARLDGCGAEPELVALCQRCLAAEPEDRPADAGEVAKAVAALRADAESRARRAELDRARAEVKAAELRKRRRVQAALAVSVVAALTASGAGLGWADRQANAREAERRIRDAERQAESDRNCQAARIALDQVEAALRKDHTVYGEIDAALEQSRRRVAGGADDLQPRLAALERDREMLLRLDEIDTREWTKVEGKNQFDHGYAQENYPVAFRAYGLDLDVEPLDALARVIRGSPIAARLASALYAWQAAGGAKRLPDLLVALDPDPGRAALVRAYAAGNGKAVASRVAGLDGTRLPPDFAAFIGAHRLSPDDQARRILREALTAHPGHFGLAIRAGLRLDRNQPGEAAACFRVALAFRPTDAGCRLNLGAALGDLKDHEGACREYREAVRLDPNYGIAHNNLGNALHALKDREGAIREYREAIRLDPNYAPAHNGLGNALFERKDYAGAYRACREAVRIDPNYAPARNNLGNALRALKDYEGACREYREAIHLDPNPASARNGLGNALRDQGNLEGAAAEFREAIRLDPSYAIAHCNLGLALYDRNDPEGAAREFREAIRRDPNYATPHNGLGDILCVRGDLAGAAAEFRQAIRLNSNFANAHNGLGIALHDLTDLEAATRAYREAIRLDPNYSQAHYNLGNLLYERKDSEGSVRELQEAVRLDPNFAKAHNNLGIALYGRKDPEGAAREFREAVRLKIDWAPTYTNLAALLGQRGEARAALGALEQGARLNPSWMTDPRTGFRYDSACCAALAATGTAKDSPPEPERPGLRRRALDWLTADLAVLRNALAAPANGPAVHQKMLHWLEDTDLASVREPKELAKLPAAVRELSDQTAPRETAPPPRPER